MSQGGKNSHHTTEAMVERVGYTDDGTAFVVASPDSDEIGIVENVVMSKSGSLWLTCCSL